MQVQLEKDCEYVITLLICITYSTKIIICPCNNYFGLKRLYSIYFIISNPCKIQKSNISAKRLLLIFIVSVPYFKNLSQDAS